MDNALIWVGRQSRTGWMFCSLSRRSSGDDNRLPWEIYVESPYASLRPEIDPIPIPRWALNLDNELTAFIRIVFQYFSNHNVSRKLQVRKEVPKLLFFCSPTSAQFAREVGGESSQYPIINYTYRSLLLICYSK